MIKYFAVIDAQNVIQFGFQRDIPDEGPMPDFPSLIDGCTHVELPAPFVRDHPSPTTVPSIVDGAVVWVETASLSELKVSKNAEINANRLQANRSYFNFQGKQIACDELSRSDIDAVNGVVSLLGVVPINQWKAIDNTYVPIPDKATWIQLFMAMVQQGQQNFTHAQNLKQLLADATTAAEVANIKWE
jgi:hypothetical protein